MPRKHALRDLTLVVITLPLWRADASLRHPSGALVIIPFLAVLPFPSLAASVAFALNVAGVIAIAVLEIPPFVRVLRGGAPPRDGAYASDIPHR